MWIVLWEEWDHRANRWRGHERIFDNEPAARARERKQKADSGCRKVVCRPKK